MVEYLFISSVMNGIWRSLCNVKFETYRGALVMESENLTDKFCSPTTRAYQEILENT
jgi:hypothetical protein